MIAWFDGADTDTKVIRCIIDNGTYTFSGWKKAVDFVPGKTYRLFLGHETDTSMLTIDKLQDLKIEYGQCTSADITSLASIKKTGLYCVSGDNIENITDLPIDFPSDATPLLKVEEYHIAKPYFIQTLYAVRQQPFTYLRFTTDGAQWCPWRRADNSGSVLYGKKISFYGDSVTTYAGWIPFPDDPDAAYYKGSNCGVTSVDQTWWKKVINALGLELVVNNSFSGRAVSSIKDSVTGFEGTGGYVESNVLMLKDGNTLPEIIIVKMGINDFNSGAELGTYDGSAALPASPAKFLDAYAIMLDHIISNFPLADVYCCTLQPCERTGTTGFPEINSNGDSIGEWNDAIRKLAHAFGAKVLDHDVCGMTYYNLSTYTGDYNASTHKGLHPNAAGHSLIANQTIQQMDNGVRTRY